MSEPNRKPAGSEAEISDSPWNTQWTEFWKDHKRKKFTPAYNSYLEARIRDEMLTTDERVESWYLRRSWGNHSNETVDSKGGRLYQVDCARELGKLDRNGKVDRRQVNASFKRAEAMGYLDLSDGIRPIDSPVVRPLSKWGRTNREGKANKPSVSTFIETEWGPKHPDDYTEYQKVEKQYSEFRTRIVAERDAAYPDAEEQAEEDAGENDLQDHSSTPESEPENVRMGSDKPLSDVRMGSDNLSERGSTDSAANKEGNSGKPFVGGTSSSFASLVAAELSKHGTVDDDVLTHIIDGCQANARDCTAQEVCHFISEKAKLINRQTRNPVGMLTTAVPKCFKGASFIAYREEQLSIQRAEEERNKRVDVEHEEMLQGLRDDLANPKTSEKEKEFIRKHYGSLLERKPAESEQQDTKAKAQKAGAQ